jgi:ribonuclease HI
MFNYLTQKTNLQTPTTHPIIYTDGSCHTQFTIGAWVAIILLHHQKIILQGVAEKTTHQRMELVAVIKALEYVQKETSLRQVKIISDSQYVIGLIDRRKKLEATDFKSQAGRAINNTDLIQQFYTLADAIEIDFEKIKAHQKQTAEHNYNIDADKLCRKLVRDVVGLR